MNTNEQIVEIIQGTSISNKQKKTKTIDKHDTTKSENNNTTCNEYYLYDNKIQLHNNLKHFNKLNEISMDKISINDIKIDEKIYNQTLIYCIIITPYISLPDHLLNLNFINETNNMI